MERQGQGASSREKVVSKYFFLDTVRLHGEYGGEEGRLAFGEETAFYAWHEYRYDVCKLSSN